MASREERKGGGKILQRKPIVPRHARKKQDMLKAERERDTKSGTRVRSTSFPSLSGGVRDDAKWSSSTFSFFPLLPQRWKGRANEWAGGSGAWKTRGHFFARNSKKKIRFSFFLFFRKESSIETRLSKWKGRKGRSCEIDERCAWRFWREKSGGKKHHFEE